jgi:Putative beta barrel porin-7 (BBP7)
LLTASPAGTPQAQAGVAGTPGVATLFGGSRVDDDWRSGGRLRVGSWLDCQQTLGVEVNFFMLEDAVSRGDVTSRGSPILARPFFNTATGQPDAELIAFPGSLAGTFSARETSTLLGAGAWLRYNLCCGDCVRVDALLGYRYLRLTDHLGIREDLVSTDANNPNVPLGTQLSVVDQFHTTNDFHGADLGLTGEFRRGPWALGWLAKVAVGPNLGVVDVSGATTVTVPGFAPQTSAGGLLALSSNSGHFDRNRVAVVPELGVKLSYQVTPRLRALVGYDFLYWTDVVRPGGQIDTAINPNLLPPPLLPLVGPNRLAPRLSTSDVWVQGISFGLEFRY